MKLKLEKFNKLLEDKNLFENSLEKTKKEYRNLDPGQYLYNLLLNKRKISDIYSDEYLELAYTTLIAWNMNGRGAKLADITDFKNTIRENKEIINLLKGYRIEKLDKQEIKKILEIIEKMNLTDTIAIYGAFLSTLAICWNIYNKIQDKPKVKVSVNFGFMDGDNFEKQFLFINAVNFGKRAVSLSSYGLRSGKEDVINPIKNFSLPCELGAGKSHVEWFETDKLKIEKLKGREFDFAWYRDETGRLYKSKSIKERLNNYFKK